jgi:hypothetical protein
MINVDVDEHNRYSVMFDVKQVVMGKNQLRWTVTCDLYAQPESDRPLVWVTRGVSILNPLDKFNETIGMHKSLASALEPMVWLSADQRRKMHQTVDGWTSR